MLTLYHAPKSRSSAIVTLLDELGALDQTDIRIVDIPRMMTGTGAPDPANPHPEKKVPLLIHNGTAIRERGAIILYLTDLFPKAGLGRPINDSARGSYLSWLFYYHAVMEPVFVTGFAGLSHPMLMSAFRDTAAVTARLTEALSASPYLLGNSFSAADLLVHSPFAWAPQMMPDVPVIRDWVARCADRPAARRTAEYDSEKLAMA